MTRGHLYKRGRVWWMKFYVDGRPVYESTGQEKEQAQRVLNGRLGKIAAGQPIVPRLDRITYVEVAKDLKDHYASSGSRDTWTRSLPTTGLPASDRPR
jgi:hypothetical protein